MAKLTAVFEHWHLGDGNYYAFAVGDEVRLSFELDVDQVELVSPGAAVSFEHICDAQFAATARVIRRYADGIDSAFPVLDAGALRFYAPSQLASGIPQDSMVRLRGTLALDHYLWVEFLDRYADPPDLFYDVRVVRIRRIAIPEEFIRRTERSVSFPTSLPPEDYTSHSYEEVERVEERSNGPSFSLIDFEMLPAGAAACARPSFFGTERSGRSVTDRPET
jgi:hypothetical protein